MNANIRLLLALIIVLAASTGVLAARGGGGGAGFHGGGGYHSGGGGGGAYHGSAYHGSAYHGSGYHGGASLSHVHTPALSEPRVNESHLHANTWSNHTAGSAWAGRAESAYHHPAVGPHSGPGPHPGWHPDWYHGHWNDHWAHSWYHWPAAWWGAGFLTGLGFEGAVTPWAWGYWPYYNPYFTEPVVAEGAWIDLSQPIALAGPAPGEAESQTAASQAAELLDAARNAFLQADYSGALSDCDKALALTPNDALLHELRGLALFALHRYDEAAGTVYAVLSQGPGWDWTTLSSLYADVGTYTDQLRALEEYVAQNPNSAAARFLLAYHYTICGHADAAATELAATVKLNPKDRLSAQLLDMLTPGTPPAEPRAPGLAPAGPAAAPSRPLTAAALVGDWKANRPDGSVIALQLTRDGKYTWRFDQQGKSQEFSGPYAVADGLLILKKGDTPVMIGQATALANGFNFKLPGDNPADPGLNFVR